MPGFPYTFPFPLGFEPQDLAQSFTDDVGLSDVVLTFTGTAQKTDGIALTDAVFTIFTPGEPGEPGQEADVGEVPDWAISVPAVPGVHTSPAADSQQLPDTEGLRNMCGLLLGNFPFFGSLINMGAGGGSTGGVLGSMLSGGQGLADILCGFGTGSPSTDTTADTLLSGLSDANDALTGNSFLGGILGLGQTPSSSGNLAIDMLLGGTSFAGSLIGLLGICGCDSQYNADTVTPTDILGGVTELNDAVTGNPFAMGILGLGQDPTASGNVPLDIFNGGMSFWGSLCGLATGNTDISSATPSSVLSTAGDFLDIGNGIFGGTATDAGGLFDWTDGWFSDLLGGLGDPFGLGTGSSSMSIPTDSVSGLLGPSTIGGAFQAMVDGAYQGATQTTSTGVSLANMTNAIGTLAQAIAFLSAHSTETTGVHTPEVTHYGTAGGHTYDIPEWATHLDVVVLGGGGGGYGMPLISLWGEGGEGGHWNQVTLERDVDIPLTTTTLSCTVGVGGSGGSSGPGSNGGTSSASGTGWAGISATGGARGASGNLDYEGKSPGNNTFDNVIYYGGVEQAGYFGADGNPPGGGGAGGTVTFMPGGDGAPGSVWIVAYEEVVVS